MALKHNDSHQDNPIDQIDGSLKSASESIIRNKKVITWIVSGVVIIALLVMGYIFFIRQPHNQKALDAFNNVEVTAQGNDSVAIISYKQVADKYEGTDGGNLAALTTGEAFYDQKKFEDAIKYLKRFKTSDEMMMANVECLIGDCYVGLGKYDDALTYFDKSLRIASGNPEISPRVLDKKARVFDEQKKYDKALECYEMIQKEYPTYQDGNYPAAAFAAREKARLGK